MAHLIPEGMHASGQAIYRGGLLAAGDAAGFTLSTGFRVEGANYAMLSGMAAAEAVKEAMRRKDFSQGGLSVYPKLLRECGVLGDFGKFKHAPKLFKNSRLYTSYPEVACQFGKRLFSVEPEPKKGLFGLVRQVLHGNVSPANLMKDVFAGWRGLS
jgi:electron transfer flavoprotein-quinone oxidoreductase